MAAKKPTPHRLVPMKRLYLRTPLSFEQCAGYQLPGPHLAQPRAIHKDGRRLGAVKDRCSKDTPFYQLACQRGFSRITAQPSGNKSSILVQDALVPIPIAPQASSHPMWPPPPNSPCRCISLSERPLSLPITLLRAAFLASARSTGSGVCVVDMARPRLAARATGVANLRHWCAKPTRMLL